MSQPLTSLTTSIQTIPFLQNGTIDPTVTPLFGLPGYLYFRTSGTIAVYQKQDSGLTTNWVLTGGGAATSGGTGFKTFYVDVNRTDTYVANGSISFPFKTYTAAINQVKANGDNSLTLPYLIRSVSAATSPETIDLSSSLIVNLVIDGGYGAINTLQSTSNNTNQSLILINNLSIGTLNFTCPTNNGNLGGNEIQFMNCVISGAVTLSNVQNIFWVESELLGAISATNVNFAGFVDGVGLKSSGSLTLITNNGLPVPAGFGGTFWIVESTQMNASCSIDAGSTLVADQGSMIGNSNGANTITVNGLYRSLASFTRQNITVNNGGTYRAEGGASHVATLTVNAGGASTQTGHYAVGAVEIGGAAKEATNAGLVIDAQHVKFTQTTPPTVLAGANAGAGATASLTQTTDMAGNVSLTTGGAGLAAGMQLTVTFNKTFNVAPIVVLTPTNAAAAASTVGYFVTSTVNGFSISTLGVALSPGTWNYRVDETQP